MNKVNKNTLSVTILVLLAASAGMFFAGMSYQKSKAADNSGSQQQQFGTRTGPRGQGNGNGGAGGGGGFASGEVLAKDDQSITIKLSDGGSRIVYFSGSTTVGKMDTGSASDLKTGDQVIANGTPNSDGSIAAQNIQIRPAGAPLPNNPVSNLGQ